MKKPNLYHYNCVAELFLYTLHDNGHCTFLHVEQESGFTKSRIIFSNKVYLKDTYKTLEDIGSTHFVSELTIYQICQKRVFSKNNLKSNINQTLNTAFCTEILILVLLTLP